MSVARQVILPFAFAVTSLLMVAAVVAAQASGPPLAWELNETRKSWLFDDDASAEARLAMLEDDGRVTGELPRWYASMRAALALGRGDAAAAKNALRGLLKNARRPIEYVRAVRLLAAFGQYQDALEIVREGRVRDPASSALIRHEADLLWLSGDFDGALLAYKTAILKAPVGLYPYQVLESRTWDETRMWPVPGATEAPPPPGTPRPEPFTSLCVSPVWYPTDLPGLERLLIEASQDPARAARARAGLDAAISATREARRQLDSFRGPVEERTKLEDAARSTQWDATLTGRIAALADLNEGRFADAQARTTRALSVADRDVGLLDIQARALNAQGKAQEARLGPLRVLRDTVNLMIVWTMYYGYASALQDQMLNLILDGALNLYRSDEKSGIAEFNERRTDFGPRGDGQTAPPGALGRWLAVKGAPELARELLREASRVDGFDAGVMQAPESLWVEISLLGLDLADVAAGKDAGGTGAPAGQRPGLLGVVTRAAFIASTLYARETLGAAPGVNPFGYRRYNDWNPQLMLAADSAALETYQTAIWRLPEMLAKEVPPADLDSVLDAESAESKALKTVTDAFADIVANLRQNPRDWNRRDQYRKRLLSYIGAVEARAMVARARLIQLKPSTMKDLTDWLAKYQPQIDMRPLLTPDRVNEAADDAARRFQEQRVAAGVPEVVHSGLLLDAARALARAGKHLDAARLLMLNPVPPFGADSSVRVLCFAAVLAQKGKDEALAARCWMRAANPAAQAQVEPALTAEYPFARRDFLEFGTVADLAAYVENQYVPYVFGPSLDDIFIQSPELKHVNPALLMRNPSHEGLGFIFGGFLTTGHTGAIADNWIKILRAPELLRASRRLALWMVLCDLPTTRTAYADFEDLETRPVYFARGYRPPFSGLAFTDDYMLGLRMLAEVNEAVPGDAKAGAEAMRLRAMIARCMSRSRR